MIYAFGDFELDEERWELRENGNVLETPPKALEVLHHLLRFRERVVTKAELLDEVWTGTQVTEASLNNAISTVRRLLRDDGRAQALIRTTRSRGFRFTGEVTEILARKARVTTDPRTGSHRSASGFFVSTRAQQSDAPREIVGRESQLAALNGSLQKAIIGSGSVVLISGDPGIGKTRLLEEFEHDALRAAARVLWGWCWEEGGVPELWPWVRLLRGLESFVDEVAEGRGLSPASSAAWEYVGRILRHDSSADLPLVPLFQGEQAQFRFFDAVATALRALAEIQPLLLVLEDLHAADSATLLLLNFLSRELRRDRVLLVGAYRPDEIGALENKARLFRELIGAALTLKLDGLRQAQIGEMSRRHGLSLTERQIDALHRLTDGNPLFAQSVLSLLSAHQSALDADEIAALEMPPRLAEAIRKRIARTPARTRALLSIASVLGRQFHVRALEELGDVHGEDFAAALGCALASNILVEVPTAPGQFRFVHGLFREVLYADLPVAECSRLHRLAGEIFERVRDAMDGASHVLAHHFVKGAVGTTPEKAIFYSVEAAKYALSSFAYEEAATHYENALALLQFEQRDPRATCELLVALGYARRSAGSYAASVEAFTRAMTLARSIGDGLQLSRAALGYVHAHPETSRADMQMMQLLEEIIGVLGGLPDAQQPQAQELLAIARSRLSMSLSFTAGRDRCDAMSRDALALARKAGDPAALSYALHARHWAMWKPETLDERLTIATEMVELDPLLSDGERLTAARVCQLTDVLEMGDLPALDNAMRSHRCLAESFRDPMALWNADLFQSMRYILEGRFVEAEKLISVARSAGESLHPVNARAYFFSQMLRLRFEQGRLADFEPLLTAAVRADPDHVALRSNALGVYVELEREAEARTELQFLAKDGLANIANDWALLPCLAHLSMACAFLHERKVAELVMRRLAPYAGQHVVLGPAIVYLGPVDHYLGELNLCLGRWDDACQSFENAAWSSARLHARPIAAHARLELARARISRGKKRDVQLAFESCIESRSEAAHLGMTRLEQRAQALLANLKSGRQRAHR